jgi:hypothetical protein
MAGWPLAEPQRQPRCQARAWHRVNGPACGRGMAAKDAAVNRAADVVGASLGLALASPVLAAAAVAIKLEDGGPVFYRQRRVGYQGRDFDLLKLRTMVVGAETRGAGFAVNRGDPRITRAGRLLRRLSLDELPQLWNVVRGDMSLIGPRPTLRYQVEQYTPRQRRRLDVKPGSHRLGAGQRPYEAAVGRAHRARPLVRRAPLAVGRPEDPPPDAARPRHRHLQGRDRRLEAVSSSA